MNQDFHAVRREPKPSSKRGLTRLEILFLVVLLGLIAVMVVSTTRPPAERSADAQATAGAAFRPSSLDSDENPFLATEGGDEFDDESFERTYEEKIQPSPGFIAGASARKQPPAADTPALESLRALVSRPGVSPDEVRPALRYLTPREMEQAWAFIATMPWSKGRVELQAELMKKWAAEDPVAALDFAALSIASDRQRKVAVASVMTSWAESDPESAFAWFAEYAEDEPLARQMPIGLVMQRLYAMDPEAAFQRIWELPDQESRSAALAKIFLEDVEDAGGREELMAFYHASRDEDQQAVIAKTLVRRWAYDNPSEAAAWVGALDDPAMRQEAGWALARVWGRRAPDEAMKWLNGFPLGENKEKSIAYVAGLWAADHAEGLKLWLKDQPYSPVKEAALTQAANTLRYRDPVAAMPFAEALAPGPHRDGLRDQILQRWMRRDHDAAVSYVLHSDLPEKIKNKYVTRALRQNVKNSAR